HRFRRSLFSASSRKKYWACQSHIDDGRYPSPQRRRSLRLAAAMRQSGGESMYRRLLAVLAFAAIIAAFAAHPGSAQQGQSPLPNLRPPPPAPIKPYQAVPVAPPSVLNDPSFTAFRNQLGEVAARKDRAALAKMIVAQNFFWLQDKNLADPRKSGIDNIAKAV